MIIISWDVGVVHLAYCVLSYCHESDNKCQVNILDWDVINLIEDERLKLRCCGEMKLKNNGHEKICGKNATYYVNRQGHYLGFCRTHLSQSGRYWSSQNTLNLFHQVTDEKYCSYPRKDGQPCGKRAKYRFRDYQEKQYFCTSHYRIISKRKIREYSPQPIRSLVIKKYPTAQLQLNLIKKLDKLSQHFAKLGIEEVIIENQPSQKNPKMKSISNTLFDYFLIRGYLDKIHNLDIKLVRFICPSNKLKVNENDHLEIFKSSKNKYKLTKQLGIQYTKQLLKDQPEQLEYLEFYKKQDDLCDAYLQGRYYLEYVKSNQKGK